MELDKIEHMEVRLKKKNYWDLFIEEVKKQGRYKTMYQKAENNSNGLRAGSVMVWSESSQGHNYWEKVFYYL